MAEVSTVGQIEQHSYSSRHTASKPYLSSTVDTGTAAMQTRSLSSRRLPHDVLPCTPRRVLGRYLSRIAEELSQLHCDIPIAQDMQRIASYTRHRVLSHACKLRSGRAALPNAQRCVSMGPTPALATSSPPPRRHALIFAHPHLPKGCIGDARSSPPRAIRGARALSHFWV